MSKRDAKKTEASTFGSRGKSDTKCIPILDNRTNTNRSTGSGHTQRACKSNSCPLLCTQPSLSACMRVYWRLLSCTQPTFVFSTKKDMQMRRFPSSLGNATGRWDREIKQSRCDACGKVAIKYSLTAIQTLSEATSGRVKKLNRDFMPRNLPWVYIFTKQRSSIDGSRGAVHLARGETGSCEWDAESSAFT